MQNTFRHRAVGTKIRQRPEDKTKYVQFPGGLAQLGERQAGSLKVTGSIPVSSTQETPRTEAQSIAEQGTSENGVPCFVSGEKCNEAHNEDLNCRISRQGSAKEIAPLAVELPADLAALAAIWPSLRGNIRAAILALADVKP